MAVKLPNSLFIHTPKAGGTWIRSVFEMAHVPIQYLTPHISLSQARAECPAAHTLPSFSFVRHPFTWYQSFWCFRMTLGWDLRDELDIACRADSFPAFLSNVIERKPGWLSGRYDQYTAGVTHVGRFEYLRESFSRILERIKEPLPARLVHGAPEVNVVSRGQGWKARAAIPPELLPVLAKAEARAMKAFGYRDQPVPEGGHLIWLTGLPAAGKTTISRAVAKRLGATGAHVEVLDGDVMREALSPELGYSKEHRDEQVRRVGNLALSYVQSGAIVLVAMVSPYREARAKIRSLLGSMTEVHVHCPMDTCVIRDPKGLWKRALSGQVKGMTGLNSPYEIPENPELRVESAVESVDSAADRIVRSVLGRLG